MEKELFEFIAKGDIIGVKNLLSNGSVKAELYDEHGMTPLQHACYKGNKELAQILLDHGADVNSGKHEHSYYALHFAALAGKPEICEMLLNYGAKMSATNSVGRTPSQMAAFVGNHKCVAIINNFVPKSDVEYYTVIRGLETKPYLDGQLVVPLHTFIMQVNLHPVKVVLTLKKCSPLLEHLTMISKVLELMSEREMKRKEFNEIMAFKLHYFKCIADDIARLKRIGETSDKKGCDIVEVFIKKMLRVGKNGTDTPDQNNFLKDSIRSFPFKDCSIFRQMVTALASPDAPYPISVIATTINGQRGFTENEALCWTCGEENATKKCSKCKEVRYCDRECQRLHWFVHKKQCTREETNNSADRKIQISQATIDNVRNSFETTAIN